MSAPLAGGQREQWLRLEEVKEVPMGGVVLQMAKGNWSMAVGRSHGVKTEERAPVQEEPLPKGEYPMVVEPEP